MLFERAEDENLLEDADSFHSANNYLEEEKVQIEDIEEDKTMLMKPKKLERPQKISQPEDVFEFEDQEIDEEERTNSVQKAVLQSTN